MNEETIDILDALIRDLDRRITYFEQRGMTGVAEIVRVDKRLVEIKRLAVVRQLQERAALEQGF